MNVIPNSLGSATAQRADFYAESEAIQESETSSVRHGRAHAIPVRDYPAVSGGLADAVYRVLEIVLAAIGLIIGLPLMLIMAALVRLDSPGPALFFAKRTARSIRAYGRDLEERSDLCPPPGGYDPDALYYIPSFFNLIKFRTMYRDARIRFPHYYDYKYTPEEFHQRHFKIEHDPRVTRIGRVLRKLSVDELPNLWSVLVGDMRLVGPRPEIAEVLQYYTPEEMCKFTCKPGVTGLAQIGGRGLLSWGETLALDIEYVRTRSVALDLKIILLTMKRVIARHGAF